MGTQSETTLSKAATAPKPPRARRSPATQRIPSAPMRATSSAKTSCPRGYAASFAKTNGGEGIANDGGLVELGRSAKAPSYRTGPAAPKYSPAKGRPTVAEGTK